MMAAQRAVVRMLFDPDFAAAVRADPDATLPGLSPSLRAQLAALDDRALRVDRLRRRRALRTLCDEWKATTTLALAETGRLATLEAFFSSHHFHQSVDQRGSMPLGFAAFLAELIASNTLATRILPEVLTIETAMALVRRAPPDPPPSKTALTDGSFVQRSLSAEPIKVARGATQAMAEVDRYLFEVGLMPAVALCDDAPAFHHDPRAADATPLHLVVVRLSSGPSLVTVEAQLYLVLSSVPQAPRKVSAILADLALRGLSPDQARNILTSLVDDELVYVSRLTLGQEP